MKIAFVHFYRKPNPDYANTVASIRQRGHTVWLGEVTPNGNFVWSDGTGTMEMMPGFHQAIDRQASHPLSPILTRYTVWKFLVSVRQMLRKLNPDIVHINPDSMAWMIPLGMPSTMKFIFDVKQINMGVTPTLTNRIRDWGLGVSWQISARQIYDYACFDYYLAAERIMGPNWTRRSAAIPVGIDRAMLSAQMPTLQLGVEESVRFLYIGSINRFRELELLLNAIQQMASTTSRFQVDFIGPDQTNGYYQDQIDKLQINHVVALKPPVHYSEIPDLLTNYHVGLAYNPARPTWDYQPTIKILEYRAVGLPILSTAVRSHRDFVEEGQNGFLLENKADLWAQAMLRFVEDRALLQQIYATAQQMRRGVTHEEVAERHEQIYEQLLSSSQRHYSTRNTRGPWYHVFRAGMRDS